MTVTVAVAVHPFAGLVTVSVYVPAALTVGVAVFPPDTIPGPLQEKVAPLVEEEPFSVAVVVPQVIVCGEPALALGGVIFCVTFTVAVFVHPAGLVTVSVYVPGAFTVGVAVFPPETIPGPLHE